MQKYRFYYQAQDSELWTLEELFYEIKSDNLIEITLSEEGWLRVKQWKDVPMTYEAQDKRVFDMQYGDVYLTDWKEIYDVWDWRWEKELGERLLKCKRKEKSIIKEHFKEHSHLFCTRIEEDGNW